MLCFLCLDLGNTLVVKPVGLSSGGVAAANNNKCQQHLLSTYYVLGTVLSSFMFYFNPKKPKKGKSITSGIGKKILAL